MHHLRGQSVFDIHHDEAWGETFFVMPAATIQIRAATA
jgi:hypothetical protein